MRVGGEDHLDDLETRAWRGLLVASTRLLSRLDAELQEAQQLRVADYGVLANLAEAPECRLRMSELADLMGLSPSGLTRRVDTLARTGLVQRVQCPEDKRGTFASLTEAGRRRLAEAHPHHVAQVRQYFADRLDREELAVLVAVTDAIMDGLRAPSLTV